jgi:hypothetical protein
VSWAGSAASEQSQSQSADDSGAAFDLAALAALAATVEVISADEHVGLLVQHALVDSAHGQDHIDIAVSALISEAGSAVWTVQAAAEIGPVVDTATAALSLLAASAIEVAEWGSATDFAWLEAALALADGAVGLDGFISVDGRTRIADVRMSAHPRFETSVDVTSRRIALQLTNGTMSVDGRARSVAFTASKRLIQMTLI